jgi:predicted transcriptional regulator
VDLYRTSGIGRIEFCRSHGMSLSTLNRNLKKQQKQSRVARQDVERSCLVAVELGATVSAVTAEKLTRVGCSNTYLRGDRGN